MAKAAKEIVLFRTSLAELRLEPRTFGAKLKTYLPGQPGKPCQTFLTTHDEIDALYEWSRQAREEGWE